MSKTPLNAATSSKPKPSETLRGGASGRPLAAGDLGALQADGSRGRALNKNSPRIGFRISQVEKELFEARVRESGLTKSEFFRDVIMTNKTVIESKAPESESVKMIAFFVRKASSDINEIARTLSTENAVSMFGTSTLIEALEELQTISKLLKAGLTWR